MDESYPAMQARHDDMDFQMQQQDDAAQWAGPAEYQTVAPPDPDRIQDCTNCRYTVSNEPPYWCRPHNRFVEEVKDSCWSWDPKEEKH